MKELSIEEKARRYDGALERAKEQSSKYCLDKIVLEDIFPELKDSEDEQIRKAVIDAVETLSDSPLKVKMLAWLEKQGEQNLANSAKTCKDEPKFKVKYAGSEYNVLEVKYIAGITYYGIEDEPNHIDYVLPDNCEIVRDYSYGVKEKGSPYPTKSAIFSEQKPADLKTKAGNWYICDMEVMNENMVTAFHRDEIYYCPKDGYLDAGGVLFEVGCLDVFRLATEKEIPQPKPAEWSEEDEERLQSCLNILQAKGLMGVTDTVNSKWLKSLKDRVQPQPKQEWSLKEGCVHTSVRKCYL